VKAFATSAAFPAADWNAPPSTKIAPKITDPHGLRGKDATKDLTVTVEPVGSLYTIPSAAYRRAVYTGWTPDSTRHDLDSVDVAATDVAPYWVRVQADAQAPPGTYRILIVLSADGKRSQTLTMTATMWPFTIPDEPKLFTAFQFTPWIINELYGLDDESAREAMKHKSWSFLDEYKIKPDQIYTLDRADDGTFIYRPAPVEDPLYIQQHYGFRAGLSAAGIGLPNSDVYERA